MLQRISMTFCIRMNFLVVSLLLHWKLSQGCQEFKGIGDSSLDWYTEAELSSLPNTQFIQFINFLFPEFFSFETPVQARTGLYDTSGAYNVLSAYESSATELFGRIDVSNQRRFWKQERLITIIILTTHDYLHYIEMLLYGIFYITVVDFFTVNQLIYHMRRF